MLRVDHQHGRFPATSLEQIKAWDVSKRTAAGYTKTGNIPESKTYRIPCLRAGEAQRFRFRRRSAMPIIAQTKPSPAQLLAQDAILCAKVIHDLQLLLIHPAGDGDQQETETDPEASTWDCPLSPTQAHSYRRKFSRIEFSDPMRRRSRTIRFTHEVFAG